MDGNLISWLPNDLEVRPGSLALETPAISFQTGQIAFCAVTSAETQSNALGHAPGLAFLDA